MKGFIIYPTYRTKEGKPQVLLYGRLENGKSFLTISDFKPYFWIKETDIKKTEELIEKNKINNIAIEKSDFKNFDSSNVAKVTLGHPAQVKDTRSLLNENSIPCYESDIRFAYRFLIDNDIKACIDIEGTATKDEAYSVDEVYENPKITPTHYAPELKVLSIDIETDMEAKKLYAISLYGKGISKVLLTKEGNYKNAECFASEKETLKAFAKNIIEYDPDIIIGWNLIDFDFVTLKKMFEKHKIPFVLGRTKDPCTIRVTESFFTDSSAKFPGRAVLDGIHLMKVSFLKLDDYKLNTAAKQILGKEKLLTSEDRGNEIQDLFEKDPQMLIDYNLLDSQLVFEILEKSKTLDLTIRRSILTRMQPERVNASIASFDSLYLKELQKRKIVAPSTIISQLDERIKGGFVMESKPGIYDSIIVCDFKSLYPSIIRTFNIDPFSFVPYEKYLKLKDEDKNILIEAPNRAHFRNEDGILPIIIEQLWKQRDEAKKRKDLLASQAIKILMNSFFGILANPNCRFYSLEMANAITHFGQFLNKLTAQKIQELGYEVIYSDTDSVFVNPKTDDVTKAKEVGREVENYINEFYKAYVTKKYNRHSFLELEFEKTFNKFLMPKVRGQDIGAKKRYAGLVIEDGKEEIKVVGLEIVRRDWTELAKNFQRGILDHLFHDKPYEDFIKGFVNDLREGKLDTLLVYKKAIRKEVSKYTKTTPPHIKAARKLGREVPGIIEYAITLNGPEPMQKLTAQMDYDHYIEKQLKPIADSILSFQDKSFDDLVSKQKQTDLSSWG